LATCNQLKNSFWISVSSGTIGAGGAPERITPRPIV